MNIKYTLDISINTSGNDNYITTRCPSSQGARVFQPDSTNRMQMTVSSNSELFWRLAEMFGWCMGRLDNSNSDQAALGNVYEFRRRTDGQLVKTTVVVDKLEVST